MLVLTRKVEEKIIIDGNITLTLLSCDGGRIRIGIDAPREARVMRAELLERQEAPDQSGYSAGIESVMVS